MAENENKENWEWDKIRIKEGTKIKWKEIRKVEMKKGKGRKEIKVNKDGRWINGE